MKTPGTLKECVKDLYISKRLKTDKFVAPVKTNHLFLVHAKILDAEATQSTEAGRFIRENDPTIWDHLKGNQISTIIDVINKDKIVFIVPTESKNDKIKGFIQEVKKNRLPAQRIAGLYHKKLEVMKVNAEVMQGILTETVKKAFSPAPEVLEEAIKGGVSASLDRSLATSSYSPSDFAASFFRTLPSDHADIVYRGLPPVRANEENISGLQRFPAFSSGGSTQGKSSTEKKENTPSEDRGYSQASPVSSEISELSFASSGSSSLNDGVNTPAFEEIGGGDAFFDAPTEVMLAVSVRSAGQGASLSAFSVNVTENDGAESPGGAFSPVGGGDAFFDRSAEITPIEVEPVHLRLRPIRTGRAPAAVRGDTPTEDQKLQMFYDLFRNSHL